MSGGIFSGNVLVASFLMVAGLTVSIAAGLTFCVNPTNRTWVLVTLMIRAFGALPITYICMAMLADALDHVE